MGEGVNYIAFFLTEGLLVLFGALLIALRPTVEVVYGKDDRLLESVGIGMLGGFLYGAFLTVFWSYLARRYWALSNKYSLILIATVTLGIAIFTSLASFIDINERKIVYVKDIFTSQPVSRLLPIAYPWRF